MEEGRLKDGGREEGGRREEGGGRRREGRGREKGWNVLSNLDVWLCKVVNCARHPKVDPPKVL